MTIDRSRRDLILSRVWPLKQPIMALTLTFDEWVALGADPEYPNGLTTDAQLTLLENAVAESMWDQIVAVGIQSFE